MILVTGGTGLVGSHLLVELSKKYEKVRAIRRKYSDIEAVRKVFSYYFNDVSPYFSKIEWVEADIVDTFSLEKAFDGITHVYHSAAIISFNPKEYKRMRKVNIEGTANVVNFCIANDVLKLCFVSSVAAVGKSQKGSMIDESCEWNVETSNYGYAITKHGAEMEVWRGTQEGLDVVIVNPGVILGSGYWNSGSGKIFDKVYNGLRFFTEGVTGYVGVEDVVRSMMKLMNNTVKNERFILVSENWSYKKVFGEIAVVFNKRKSSIKITRLMSQIVWRVSSLISIITKKEPLLTRHSAESIHKKNIFSNAKIKEAIGIEFKPIKGVINQSCSNYIKEKRV